MSLDSSYQSRKICVFRNGDAFYPGKKIVVSLRVFRNWEQFLHSIGDQVPLTAGAVRKIYDIQGKRINHMDDIEDGGDYIASGGEPFRKVNYPQSINSVRQTPVPPGMTRRQALLKTRDGGDTEEKRNAKSAAGKVVFGPSTKAYRVHLFVNGDSANAGVRFLLNARNCRTFEQLLTEVSKPLQLHTATAARRLYDGNTAKRITRLEDLRDGQWIVATMGNEPFKHAPYYEADESVTVHKKKEEPLRVVTFFPNGDSYHTGVKVTVNSFKFPDIEKLMSSLDHQVPLITGRIKRICTLSGQRIENTDQLEHRNSYVVLAGNEPFQKIRYNINAPETPSVSSDRESVRHEVISRELPTRQKIKSEKKPKLPTAAAENTSALANAKKKVLVMKEKQPARTIKASKSPTKQRPSILPEEQEEAEEPEENTCFAPGAGPQKVAPRAQEEIREQQELANEFQKTIKSIKKQLGDDNENKSDAEPEIRTRPTKEDTSHRKNGSGDQIEEEEGAKVQGDDKSRRLEGELQHFNKDHAPQTKKKKKAIGPNRKDADDEEEDRPASTTGYGSEEVLTPEKSEERNLRLKNSPLLDRTEASQLKLNRTAGSQPKLKQAEASSGSQPKLKQAEASSGSQPKLKQTDSKLKLNRTETLSDQPTLDRTETSPGSQRSVAKSTSNLKSKNDLSAKASPKSENTRRQDEPNENSRSDLASPNASDSAENTRSNAELNRPTVATLTGEILREELRRSNAALTRVRAGGSADDLKRSSSSISKKQSAEPNYVAQSSYKSRESVRNEEPRETNLDVNVSEKAEERDQQSDAISTLPRSSSKIAIETETV